MRGAGSTQQEPEISSEPESEPSFDLNSVDTFGSGGGGGGSRESARASVRSDRSGGSSHSTSESMYNNAKKAFGSSSSFLSFSDIAVEESPLTEEDIRVECHRLFRALDGNHDDAITKIELIRGLHSGDNASLVKVCCTSATCCRNICVLT